MGLKTYLNQFTKAQLIEQILELNKKYKDVSNYYAFSINPDSDSKAEELKVKIFECFYPKRGYKLDLKQARKIVTDFKKLSPGEEHLIDLMLYYVECGVSYTNDFGDVNEPFYNSIESMFKSACNVIVKTDLQTRYAKQCEKILQDTEDVGWGLHYGLSDIYETII